MPPDADTSQEPRTREEAVRFLRARGVEASLRDFALGRTVVVPGERVETTEAGVRAFERVVWVVEPVLGTRWQVVDPRPNVGALGAPGALADACALALRAVGEAWEALGAAGRVLRVEGLFQARGRWTVIAGVADGRGALEVDPETTLAGCPVEPWLEQPRKRDEDGRARTDLWAFILRDPEDAPRFAVGGVCALLPGRIRALLEAPPGGL